MDLYQRLNYLFNNQDYEHLWHTALACLPDEIEKFDLKTWECIEKSRLFLGKRIDESLEEKFLEFLVVNYPEKFLTRTEKLKLRSDLNNKWQFKRLKTLYGLGRPQEFNELAQSLLENTVVLKQYTYANLILEYLSDKFLDKTKLDFADFMLKTIFSTPEEVFAAFNIIIDRVQARDYMRHTLASTREHLTKLKNILKNISYNDYRVQYMNLYIRLLLVNEDSESKALTTSEIMQIFLLGKDNAHVLINIYLAITDEQVKGKIKNLILGNANFKEVLKLKYPLLWKEWTSVSRIEKVEEEKLKYEIINNNKQSLSIAFDDYLKDTVKLSDGTEELDALKNLPSIREDYDGVVAYIQMGLLDLAQDVLAKLKEDIEVIYLRLEILLRQKKYIDVLTSIQEYKEKKIIGPELSIEFRYQEAMAYWGLNKKLVAKKILKTIYVEDPNYRLVKELYRND